MASKSRPKPISGCPSSSSLAPSPRWTYDVFLSFRGEDTRKSFVDHLYTALQQKGIYTFKDDKRLEKGEAISPELLKAIENARFAVIVFSTNYASSSWCLDELVKIVECKNSMGQTILPVFYDVEPSNVRKQEGLFGESFPKQEDKVLLWKAALTEAGSISGWDLRNTANGHESKCIQQIVGVIMSKLGDTVSSDVDNLVGVECRVQKMISLLAMGVEDVRIVGIRGVSGIGKTIIAKVTFDKISNQFEGCSFLHEVGESSKKYGRQALQEKLLSEILMERDVKIKNVFEGINVTKQRLRHKKVFVVLDDVDHADQLEALAGNRDWFGQGSRIIITTRNKSLLYHNAVDETYEVKALNDSEATQLFRLSACKNSIAEEEDGKLTYHVVKFAGGLPLAVKVLGSFLGDTDNNERKSALQRLEKSQEDAVLRQFSTLNTLSQGGLLSAGPWGGEGGGEWSYKPKGAIVKIVIGHGRIIDSIMFKSNNEDGSQEYSPKFGGGGGGPTEIVFDSPAEYLTGISLTYGAIKGIVGFISITSILLRTNVRKYGRFGSETGISASLPLKGGTIVGFYGRSGWTVNALGIYARPKRNASCASLEFKDLHSFLRDRDEAERGSALGSLHKLEEDEILRQFSTWDALSKQGSLCAGPWGGEGGREWNYEPSGAITKIVIGHGRIIDSIMFKGKNDDGLEEYSPKFGGHGGGTTQIDFDHPSEYLTGISLTYGTIRGVVDYTSITSLRFITNVKAYGPFGSETGTFASFPSRDGVIAGFHGRAGSTLDAIGIYAKPKYS